MKKSILIHIIFVLSLSQVQSQIKGPILLKPILNEIDNKKEIRTYQRDYMRTQEFFDNKGNLVFSKHYNRDGEILSIQYNRYTDEGKLEMRIMCSTISSLKLYYLDHTEGKVVKKYNSSRKYRGVYHPKTKKFLQEVTTIENLLKHNQMKKLLRKKRKSKGEIYLDSKGRMIKEINRNSKNKIISIVSYEYDKSDNIIKSISISKRQKIEEKYMILNKYDTFGNRIKVTRLKDISEDDIAEKWLPIDSTETKYNIHNKRIEQHSTFGVTSQTKRSTKTVWKYDEENHLLNRINYDVEGKPKYENRYEYDSELKIHEYYINYEQMEIAPDYKPRIRRFEIELY